MRTQGFTLIEILVVLGLIALALALAWPKTDTQSRLPGQFAEALSAYLNAAAAGADGRQSDVCVQKSGQAAVTTPATQPALKIPKEIETDLSQVCFSRTGQPTSAVNIGVKHVKDADYTLHVASEGIYGKIRVVQ